MSMTKYGTSLDQISKTAADRGQLQDRRLAETQKLPALKDDERKKRPSEKENK